MGDEGELINQDEIERLLQQSFVPSSRKIRLILGRQTRTDHRSRWQESRRR